MNRFTARQRFPAASQHLTPLPASLHAPMLSVWPPLARSVISPSPRLWPA